MSCFKQADSPLLFSSSSLNPVAGSRKPEAGSQKLVKPDKIYLPVIYWSTETIFKAVAANSDGVGVSFGLEKLISLMVFNGTR